MCGWMNGWIDRWMNAGQLEESQRRLDEKR